MALYTHTHTHTSSLVKDKKVEEKKTNKINKEIILPMSILLILILIGTLVVFVLKQTQESDRLQVEKTELNLQDNENMHVEEDTSGDKVPVPNGYVGSNATGENEIDTGYVIYEGEDEVTDSNVQEAQKTRNQYVYG